MSLTQPQLDASKQALKSKGSWCHIEHITYQGLINIDSKRKCLRES